VEEADGIIVIIIASCYSLRESVVLLILGDEMMRPYMLRVREVAIMIMMRNERMTTSKAGGRRKA